MEQYLIHRKVYVSTDSIITRFILRIICIISILILVCKKKISLLWKICHTEGKADYLVSVDSQDSYLRSGSTIILAERVHSFPHNT